MLLISFLKRAYTCPKKVALPFDCDAATHEAREASTHIASMKISSARAALAAYGWLLLLNNDTHGELYQ